MSIDFIPYKSMTISTALSPEDAARVLADALPTRPAFWPAPGHIEFRGKVSPYGFRIHRNISYRNSFLPVMYGRFHSTGHGTLITIRITFHWSVLIFLAVFPIFVVSSVLHMTTPLSMHSIIHEVAIFFGFILALYAMAVFGYNIEIGRALCFLKQVYPLPSEKK